MLVLKMQCVRLLGRITNISLLRKEAILQRKLFTMEGSGKGNIVPCRTAGDVEQDKKILQPYTYLQKATGKGNLWKFMHAFNYWLKVPADKLTPLEDIFDVMHNAILLIDDIQDNSILRRGIPVAHTIYGVPSTISVANCQIYRVLEMVLSLNHPEAVRIFTKQALELHRGQAMDIYCRDNYICPSVEEYQEIIKRKSGCAFMFIMQLMQLFSENKADLVKVTELLGLYYQIRDDYCMLRLQEYAQEKGCYHDITEGKFSLPVVHAILSHPDDSQVMHILRQRTHDVELKKYCVTLLEKFGSLSYTRHTLEELDAEIRAEVAKLGDNPVLEAMLDELLNWKMNTIGNNTED